MIAGLHRLLGRVAALFVAAVALSGVVLAVILLTVPPPATRAVSVADLLERLDGAGTLDRLSVTPAGVITAQFSAPRRRASVDPTTGALTPLPAPGPVERLATDAHRSFGLGSDAGRLGVAGATVAALVLAGSGLLLLRRRPRKPGAVATTHRWLGIAVAAPLAVSAATGLMLTASSFFPVAIDGLRPPFVAASGGAALHAGAIAALAEVPLSDLEDLVPPRGDDAEDSYHLTTIDRFVDIDPATGAVIAARDRPVWHRVSVMALKLHAGYGLPVLAALLGLASAALVVVALGGLVLDLISLAARRRIASAAAPAGTVVLYGTAQGTTRAFAHRLAARLGAAGVPVAVAAMNDAAAHADAARLILLTATDGAGVAPPTADRFLVEIGHFTRVPDFAVLGFGDTSAARYCGYAEDVEAALTARGGTALLPLGRVDRRDDATFTAWTETLIAALRPKAPVTPASPPTRRLVLSGAAMGAFWTATLHAPDDVDLDRLRADLAERVGAIEAALSRFVATSDVVRLDAAPLETWVPVTEDCVRVLTAAVDIGKRSGGAFDVGLAAEVSAAGFGLGWARTGGPPADDRRPAHEALEVDVASRRVLKRAPVAVDLAGIAKGYAVDELARIITEAGIASYLVGLDGELKAGARQPDGRSWAVGVEAPVTGRRDVVGRLDLVARAVATSGDYRRHDLVGHGHTLDPATGRPRRGGPAAVTVLAPSCMAADAWATALLVAGRPGLAAARAAGVEALFIDPAAPSVAPSLFHPTEPARCAPPSE
jgi:thiamine biosynthesis lipoprotein ApbE